MLRHTLYAYVDGADLDEIAEPLLRRLHAFASEGPWLVQTPTVVNQRDNAITRDGDLPLWNMGVNLSLPDVGSEPSGWFGDVERIASFGASLHAEFHRDFVLGIHDATTGVSEDLFFIDTETPDLVALRRIVGTEPPSGK